MKSAVEGALQELRAQFPEASLTLTEDSSGGVYFFLDGIELGPTFVPERSWLGAHIPALYPYADVYPVFTGGNVCRADGKAFEIPVTAGHMFQGRPALQVSRRTRDVQAVPQSARTKLLKVIDFLMRLR